MKDYKFLFKPVFFIFSIMFATWLVLKIEKLSPSDMGKYESLFKNETTAAPSVNYNKDFLKALFIRYKLGAIDSQAFDHKLEEFVKNK